MKFYLCAVLSTLADGFSVYVGFADSKVITFLVFATI